MEEKAERKSEFNPSGNSAWKDHIPIRVLCNPSAENFLRALRTDGAFGVIRHLPDDFARQMHGCTSRRLQVIEQAA